MNDDEQAKALPTRHSDSRPDGGAMGAAQERQMRSSVPDTNSFNTRFMTNADGSTTRLRTRGGMCEYVTEQLPTSASETLCKLAMDSGVVDLLSASFLHNNTYDDSSGVLYRTAYVQQVVAGPVGGITGPVIGEIKPPKSAGTAPDNGTPAKSFIASEEKGSPYDKKRLTAIVPPSIFTGKMRMYVQALYGRHDHAEMLQLPTDGGGRPPMLYMDWSKKFGTEENPVTGSVVAIDTNCGIHTDTTTGVHTLICINGTQATLYKLNPSRCAKKLRKSMLDPATPNGDKVRIESYILSESKPDITSKVTLDIGGYAPRYSFGYGWHFNYAGTCCDMVDTIVGYSGENVSTHYRLTFSKDAFGTWSVEYEIVEGPTAWKNYRHQHVIAYPHWSYDGLQKFGINSGVQPFGNAPFYAFYIRQGFSDMDTGSLSATMGSELMVSRYSATESTVPKGATKTPAYMNHGQGNYVFGSDPFDYRNWQAHDISLYSVSCGSASVSAKDESFSKGCVVHSPAVADWTWDSVNGFFADNLDAGTFSVPTGQGVPENCVYDDIYDEYEGYITVCGQVLGQQNLGPYDQEEVTVGSAFLLGRSMVETYSTWSDEYFSSAETYTCSFIVVAPFDDAEALYMLSTQNHQSLETGTVEHKYGGQFYASHAVRAEVGGLWTIIAVDARLGSHSAGVITGSSTFTDRDASSEGQTNTAIVANYGVQTGVSEITNQTAFYDPTDEIVPVVVRHKSSAVGVAAHSDDFGVNEGMPTVTLTGKPFTFVGWA